VGDSPARILDRACGQREDRRRPWGPFDRADLEDLAPDYWLEKPQDLASFYEP